MTRANRPRYAARLNAFKAVSPPKATPADLIAAAGSVAGLNAADLNYPDHFQGSDPQTLSRQLDAAGLALNGLAMRYYSDPGFKLGAFTHPDAATRRRAIDETKAGLDTCQAMGGEVMTLWMGQDGFDYAFQLDYARAWSQTIEALAALCDYAPAVQIAIEAKPNDPRAFALMPDTATTLLACREVARPNLGVTLDLAHLLYADEMPAYSAAQIARHSRLLGLHLNDGYGKRDDGLMVGSVHPVQTVELLVEVERQGYDGVIYFDTFPDAGGLDPIAEAQTNILLVERLRDVAAKLVRDPALTQAIAQQDAAASTQIVAAALYGRG